MLMKKNNLIQPGVMFICLIIMILVGGEQVYGQDGKKSGLSPEMAAMMEQYYQFSQPVSEHKELAQRVGKWQTETKMWFDPQSAPLVSKGICEYKLMLGGRFLLQELSGELNGKPFQGMGITGYDKFKKQYTSTWVDSFSTGIFSSLGTADANGKVITFIGEMDEPLTGEKNKKIRSLDRVIDNNKHIFEMYDNIPGVGEVKVVEITFTRQ
jgi:hypothetical protein